MARQKPRVGGIMNETEATETINKYLRVAATLVRQAADLIGKVNLNRTIDNAPPIPIAVDEQLIADLQLSTAALQRARSEAPGASGGPKEVDPEVNGAFTKWQEEEDRRQEARVALTLEVRWDGLSGEDKASTSNISGDGCYVESAAAVSVNDHLSLEIRMPTGGWMLLHGKVTHHQPAKGFGLHFINLSGLEREILTLLIDYAKGVRRKPAGFDTPAM